VIADATVVEPADPARRWMRGTSGAPLADSTVAEGPAPVAEVPTARPVDPPPPAMPGSLPLPFPDPAPSGPTGAPAPVADGSAPAPPDPAPADDRPSHRRNGLLFEPDAWDDTTTPPSPDGGG
jgi:hypothetical protein